MCKLCQDEKFLILKMLTEKPMLAINERSDLLKECGHKYKELLMDIGLYDKSLEAPVDPTELGEDTHITQIQSDTWILWWALNL